MNDSTLFLANYLHYLVHSCIPYSPARSERYSHEFVSDDDDGDDEAFQQPFENFSSTAPRFSHLMDQYQLSFDEHEHHHHHHHHHQQQQQKTSGPKIVLEPKHEKRDSGIAGLEEASNSEPIKILEESNKKGLLSPTDAESGSLGHSLPESVNSLSESANEGEGNEEDTEEEDESAEGVVTTIDEVSCVYCTCHVVIMHVNVHI